MPGASTISLLVDAEGGRHPALVIQRFGHGRTAAMMVGDTWRWGFRDEESHSDMGKSWRQFIRWLVTDAPGRVDVVTEPRPLEGDGAVLLQVRVRDLKFQPLDNASVTVEVRPVIVDAAGGAQTNIIRLPAEPNPHHPGLYEATYVSRGAGAYQARVNVTAEEGTDGGRAQTGWATDLPRGIPLAKTDRPIIGRTSRGGERRNDQASDVPDFVKHYLSLSSVMGPELSAVHTPALFALPC